MKLIFVALEVFHPLMIPLNWDLLLNASCILVTHETSQSGIAPNSLDKHIPFTGLVLKHAAMAELKFSSMMRGTCIGGGGGLEEKAAKAAAEGSPDRCRSWCMELVADLAVAADSAVTMLKN
jgi:hypothetical protein